MAPSDTVEDYYAILQITVTADQAGVTASYRRLARDVHPDRNPTNPNATAEFQRIQAAYEVLNDPETRSVYDRRYPAIRWAKENSRTPHQHHQPSPPTESKKAVLQRRHEQLMRLSDRQKDDLQDAAWQRDILKGELEQFQEHMTRASQAEAAQPGWLGYFASFWSSRDVQTQKKLQRERRQHDRNAAKRIKEERLQEGQTRVQTLKADLDRSMDELFRISYAMRLVDAEEKEARKRQAEAEEERKRRMAELAERVRQAREEHDFRNRSWQSEEAERASETRTWFRESHNTSTSTQQSSCQHTGWWPKVQGCHRCARCKICAAMPTL